MKTKQKTTIIYKDKVILKSNLIGKDFKTVAEIEIEIKEEQRESKLDIDLNEVTKPFLALSMMGYIYRPNKGRVHEIGGGQCHEAINELFGVSPEVSELINIWKTWHLNDLTPGTRNQTKCIESYCLDNKCAWPDYDTCLDILNKAGLKEDRGYKYGAKWLLKPLPKHITEYIKEIVTSLNNK